MITQKEIELCQEMLALAMKINSLGKYQVRAGLLGHVESFEVCIQLRPSGQVVDGFGGFAYESYSWLTTTPNQYRDWYKQEDFVASVIEKLTSMRDNLAEFLEKESV